MRFVWVVIAVVAVGVAATPTLVAWWYDADYLWTAHESASYRFFYAQRWLEREPTDLFLPQGYLTSLVHMLVYRVVVTVPPGIGELRTAIQHWAVTSNLIWHTVLFGGLVAFMWQRVRLSERLAAILAAVGPLLLTGAYGWNYLLLPDYYQSGTVLAALTVFLFLTTKRRPDVGWWTVLLLGAWTGLLASNKVTWVLFGLLPLVPIIVGRLRCLRQLASTLAVAGAGSVLAFTLVHIAIYSGDVVKVARIAPIWFASIQSFSNGGASDFWTWPMIENYLFTGRQLGPLVGFTLMLAVVLVRSRREQLLIALTVAFLAVQAILVLSRRSEGTTNYETLVMLIALTAMLIGGWGCDRVVRWTGYSVLVAAAVLAYQTWPVGSQLDWLSGANRYMDVRWEIHHAIMASGRPAVVVMPLNENGFSSIEQAMFKGLTLPGQQGITSDNPAVARLAPGLSVRVEVGTVPMSDPYPEGITLALFERLNREPLAERFPAVAEALARTQTCRAWLLNAMERVTVCE